MASVNKNTSLREYQDFVRKVYGVPNDRFFSLWDMIINMERFMMRGLKGIRKKDRDKTRVNLLISLSWFMSIMNQLHLGLEEEVWKRFPYLCSYCASCPCVCGQEKPEKRKKASSSGRRRPVSIRDLQGMFREIYPPQERTVEQAGVHLAEEAGEFSETVLVYRSGREKRDFQKVKSEAADLFSCLMGVFNSLDIDVARNLSVMFSNNCHICNNVPCTCDFKNITDFES